MSNRAHRFGIDLGPVTVAVETHHTGLIEYLREFYPVVEVRAGHPVVWTVRAEVAAPEPGMALTPWQVGLRADTASRVLTIRSTNVRDLAITTRKAVREALLDHCEAHRYTMLHASAVADDRRVILVVGDKGSGKTTLALNATLRLGHRYLSNDHLILYRTDRDLVLTSLPTPIPIKIGTYLDYEQQLGQPWENEGVDIAAFRRTPQPTRYGHDHRLLFTFARLGQPNPLHTPLGRREVTVVLARYALDGVASPPTIVNDPAAALWPHVRFDWVFDPGLNTHYLPRRERDREEYTRDSRDLLAELADHARIVEWRHRGELSPFLDWLDSDPGAES